MLYQNVPFILHVCILHLGKHVKIDLEYQWAWCLYWKVWMNFVKVYLCLTKRSGIFKNSKCLYCSVSLSVLCDIWPNWWIKLAWNNHCSCSIAFLSCLPISASRFLLQYYCACSLSVCSVLQSASFVLLLHVFTWHMHGHSGRCCCCCCCCITSLI